MCAARVLLADLHGDELLLGIVLGSWLALLGLGALLGGRVARGLDGQRLGAGLALLLLLLPAALVLGLALERTALPALAGLGVVVSPGRAVVLALACLAPPCLLLGAAYSLAALSVPGGLEPARWAAFVFGLEGLGTVAAGLLFHLALFRAGPLAGAFAAALPSFAVALTLVPRPVPPRRRTAPLAAALVGGVALLHLLPAVASRSPLGAALSPGQPGYEILEEVGARHAALSVLRRGDQILFLANGVAIFTNQDEEHVEADLHLSLLAHPSPRRVLLLGGCLGGGAREALRHPVLEVDCIELDPELVDLARRFGGPALRAPLDDPRLHVIIDDGRRVVSRSEGLYDAILVGMPGPSSALVNRFYTEEFFASARRALRPGGVLRVSLQGSDTYLSDEAATVHATVASALGQAFGRTPPTAIPGPVTLLLAGRDTPPDLRTETLVARFRTRHLAPRVFSEAELAERTLPFKRELYEERVREVSPLENTDLAPAAYFHESVERLAITSRPLARALGSLERTARHRPLVVAGAGLLGAFLLGLAVARRGGAGLAMAVCGFAGLAVELALLLAYQTLRGVVFHEMGLLFTAFMLGLLSGAQLGRALVRRLPRRALLLACVLSALAATLCAAAIEATVGRPGAAWALVAALALLGLATGSCYPAASTALSARRGAGGAAASIYAWDLAGASVGAVLASSVILPVLGLTGATLLCAALCLGTGLSSALRRG
jgi:spermidine synthase